MLRSHAKLGPSVLSLVDTWAVAQRLPITEEGANGNGRCDVVIVAPQDAFR